MMALNFVPQTLHSSIIFLLSIQRDSTRQFQNITVSNSYRSCSANVCPAIAVHSEVIVGNTSEIIEIRHAHRSILTDDIIHRIKNHFCVSTGVKENIIIVRCIASIANRAGTHSISALIVIVPIRHLRCRSVFLAATCLAIQDHIDTGGDNVRNRFFDSRYNNLHQNIRFDIVGVLGDKDICKFLHLAFLSSFCSPGNNRLDFLF
nr:MAG TPA: hypothetical protein [Caudoviricetes sp.]